MNDGSAFLTQREKSILGARCILLRGVAIVLVMLSGCKNGQQHAPQDGATAAPDRSTPVAQPPQSPPAEPIIIETEEPDRWVFAEKLPEGAEGGYVTGSFDEKRNRIEIRTKNIRAFALDTGRIPINWERLVVISIDGANAELRKRNQPVLHFQRTQTGLWLVQEP